jgi:hypothetical protein
MWEGITPQDRRPEGAYLAGVDTSSIFVLMLGLRYGKSDDTGYSPTHKEANRAGDIGIPRLLFERAVHPGERDGRLNDWIGSLHAELAGARYTTPEDLVAQLGQRLRELAGGQDTHWVKLLFPGTVRQQSQQGTTTFHVGAALRDTNVRRAVAALGHGPSGYPYTGARNLQLTWGGQTLAVEVASVDVQSTGVSADEVKIVCMAMAPSAQHSYAALGGVTFRGPGGVVGPADQVKSRYSDLRTASRARNHMAVHYSAAGSVNFRPLPG